MSKEDKEIEIIVPMPQVKPQEIPAPERKPEEIPEKVPTEIG